MKKKNGLRMMVVSIGLMAWFVSCNNAPKQKSKSNTKTKIAGIQRLEETIIPPTGHGDNWYMTWSMDDKQYAGMCDGYGFKILPEFKRKGYNSKLFAIVGDAPNHTFESVPGYPNVESIDQHELPGSKDYSRYYGFAILAVNGSIYQLLSTPKFPFGPEGNAFIGAKLIYSPDNGLTWHNQDGSTPVIYEKWENRTKENMAFFYEPDGCFALSSFLQMGKNYEDNTDGCVYLYSPNGTIDGKMNQLVMLRVKKEKILLRSEYEYFVSLNNDGSAKWSKEINNRGVVCQFPKGWVNYNIGPGHSGHPYAWQPSVVYNKPLGIYMMVNWGIGVGSDGDWFGKPSYLGLWTAPQPWGPWTQVYEEKAWMPGGDLRARAYQPYISPKWIANDGKSFWMIWTDFRKVDNDRPYYAFNCQKVKIIVK